MAREREREREREKEVEWLFKQREKNVTAQHVQRIVPNVFADAVENAKQKQTCHFEKNVLVLFLLF